MRAIRTWGSVRGVLGDRHPYRDLRRNATRAPTQAPEWQGRLRPPRISDLHIAGELFTCRRCLTEVGRINPGSEATVPIRFLAPELVSDKFEPGLSFRLWDGDYFADGTVLTSNFRPADP
jgi:hypothetical protein